MKKLLLCAMFATLCTTNVDASLFQSNSSKNRVDTMFKTGVGQHYKGMIGIVHATVSGWAESLSCAADDPEFKLEKSLLSTASKNLTTIAKLTKAILNRDRTSTIKSKSSAALKAFNNFRSAVISLIGTEYWKQYGVQLRLAIITINDSLMSLMYPKIKIEASGVKFSIAKGVIIDEGENSTESDDNLSTSADTTVSVYYSGLSQGFNELAQELSDKDVFTRSANLTNTDPSKLKSFAKKVGKGALKVGKGVVLIGGGIVATTLFPGALLAGAAIAAGNAVTNVVIDELKDKRTAKKIAENAKAQALTNAEAPTEPLVQQ